MEVFRNIARRRFRSCLTVFGITIGVFALMVMGGMAENMNILMVGATQYLENNISVYPDGVAGGLGGAAAFSASVAEEVKKVEGVHVVVQGITLLFDEEATTVSYGIPETISGINIAEQIEAEKYLNPKIRFSFKQGGWWEEGELGVTVLGINLANKEKASVGSIIESYGKQFEVVGILNRTMTVPDSMMYVPLADARDMLAKSQPILEFSENRDFINGITVVTFKEDANAVAARIMEELPHLKATPPEQEIDSIQQGMVLYNLIILASAIIALVVGGLSVINTMLMSVTERIREIGLKKAVGARDSDILKEYLLESSLIGTLAGLIGLGLGCLFILGVNAATAETGSVVFALTTRLALGSLLFAVFIAAFSGLYPAYRAAKINPIVALRNE